jgi:preprotein translocase subunit SecY
VIQGYFLAIGFERPETIPMLSGIGEVIQRMGPLVPEPGLFFRFLAVVSLTAGTMFLMWLGEQITERGIGNGVSLVISVGILAKLPAALIAGWNIINPPSDAAHIQPVSPFVLVLLIGFLFAVIAGTIALTQAMRKISVQYAKQVRGNKVYGGQTSFLPLKVNYSGVMPLIFAQAILLFPATFLSLVFPSSPLANQIAQMLNAGWLHYTLYAGMIFFFSFFWVALMFNPTQISDDMKKHGGYIPGVRPGEPTAKFLDYSMTRLTFAGAIFLTTLAILPMAMNSAMGVPMITAQFFGGTGLLITVGVILDTMRQAETYLLQRNYEGFLKNSKIKGRSTGRQANMASNAVVSEEKMIWLFILIGVIIIGGLVISLR